MLGRASLENSGMLLENVDSIWDPGPAWDLVDLSPFLCSLRHFINDTSASQAHYDGIHNIE